MSIITEAKRIEAAKAELKVAIEEKGVIVGDGTIDTYPDKVRAISAGGGDITQNPLYYAKIKGFQWSNVAFPEGFNFVMNVINKPDDMNGLLTTTTGLKTVTLICEAEGTVSWAQLIRSSTVEVLDISNFKPTPTSISYIALSSTKLVSIIGEIDMTNCTEAAQAFNIQQGVFKDIRFKRGTISIALSFAYCSLLTAESVQSIIDGLADLTGGTAQTIEFHSTISNSLTDEQVLQIAAKNWTVK